MPHEDVYNPLSVGLRWVADVVITGRTGQSLEGTATREITGTEVIEGKEYFVAVTSADGIPGFHPTTNYHRKGPEGEFTIVHSASGWQEYLDTPYPLVVGMAWVVPLDLGAKHFKVEAFESAYAAGKRYEDCFKISIRSDALDYRTEFYLAPDIGNVTETTLLGGATLVYTLRSFDSLA